MMKLEGSEVIGGVIIRNPGSPYFVGNLYMKQSHGNLDLL